VNLIALRMLMGDRAKYFGILIGLTFASLLITQQGAIFLGLTARTYQFVTDTPQGDLWVMDPEMEHHSDSKKMREATLDRVRSVDGVEWAVPMYRAFATLRLPNGSLRTCILVGVDDASLLGIPGEFVEGSADSLRRDAGIVVDAATVGKSLGIKQPGGGKRPLEVGDVLELNDTRAVVVGTVAQRPSFFWEPTIYTTFSRAKQFAPTERRQLTFVMVKVKDGFDTAAVQRGIESATGTMALTQKQFATKSAMYILTQTGILINFAIAVGLGFLVGAAIAGQTFFNFVNDNMRYFAALKAIGASDGTLARMVLLQSLVAAGIGFGLGAGAAGLFGQSVGDSLAFHMPWGLVVFSGVLVTGIAIGAAVLSIRKLARLEPAIVFKA
jgi:putative ABC transport system permease protein